MVIGLTVSQENTSVHQQYNVDNSFLYKNFSPDSLFDGKNKTSWREKWESNPVTPVSYDPKEEYIKHLEDKYESLR
jgi:hypothetical protein